MAMKSMEEFLLNNTNNDGTAKLGSILSVAIGITTESLATACAMLETAVTVGVATTAGNQDTGEKSRDAVHPTDCKKDHKQAGGRKEAV